MTNSKMEMAVQMARAGKTIVQICNELGMEGGGETLGFRRCNKLAGSEDDHN